MLSFLPNFLCFSLKLLLEKMKEGNDFLGSLPKSRILEIVKSLFQKEMLEKESSRVSVQWTTIRITTLI